MTTQEEYYTIVKRKLRYIKSVFKKGKHPRFETMEFISLSCLGGTDLDCDEMLLELTHNKYDTINKIIKNVRTYF